MDGSGVEADTEGGQVVTAGGQVVTVEVAGSAGRGLGWASLGRGRGSAGTGSGAAGATAAGKKFSRLSLGCFGVVGVSPEACEGKREVRQAGWAARARTAPRSAPLWPMLPAAHRQPPKTLPGLRVPLMGAPRPWRGLRGGSWARAGASNVAGPLLGATSQRPLTEAAGPGPSCALGCSPKPRIQPDPARPAGPVPAARLQAFSALPAGPPCLHPPSLPLSSALGGGTATRGPGALSLSEQKRGPTALRVGTPC